MQVQHEAQLLSPINFEPTINAKSTLDTYTLSQHFPRSIEHLACSPAEGLVAVHVGNPNQVILIDLKSCQKWEKFPLKPCDKRFSKLSFTLKGLAFSPDGTRIAVGQTDCIIYIYKLPIQQLNIIAQNHVASGKPTITGKFTCSSPITCLIWIDWGIVFGTQDGKIKLVSTTTTTTTTSTSTSTTANNLQENQSSSTASTKVAPLYNSPKGSMPISLAYKSPYLVVGFADGDVLVGQVTSEFGHNPLELTHSDNLSSNLNAARKVSPSSPQLQATTIEHSCPPVCLAIFQNSIMCCAGADGRLTIYRICSERSSPSSGNNNKFLDNSSVTAKSRRYLISSVMMQNIELRESVESLDYSSMNEILAVATRNRIMFIKYDKESSNWQQQTSFIGLKDKLSVVSSLIWSKDGASLIAGTSSGSVQMFKCSWNKQAISDELDICHIARNRIRITDRARNLLATYKTQYDIKQINLLNNGKNVIIWTSNSLLLAHLGQPGAQSEIPWLINREKGNTKFSFDHQDFVLIYNSFNRELKIIRLGDDKIAHTVQLEATLRPKSISVRRYPARFKTISSNNSSSSKQFARRVSPVREQYRKTSTGEAIQSSKPEIDYSKLADRSTERLAYVTESNHLVVVDLRSQLNEINHRHQEVINWLKLSHTGKHLLFKDSLNNLYLIHLRSSTTDKQDNDEKEAVVFLIDRCEFADWLEQSDILVAQSEYKIFVWYNIEEITDKVCLDSRSFNYSNSPPIMDLSFVQPAFRGKQVKTSYPIVNNLNNTDFIINLSNGNIIQLDVIKAKFYTELSFAAAYGNQLKAAFELLESYHDKEASNSRGLKNLWSKLGWMAIEQNECRIAMHAFDRLQHKSMINFLEECLAKPSDEQSWRLAMLSGNWKQFERLREPEQVIITYKRLNRWTQLLEFLNKTQQFRQKDLAEQEYLKWLITGGRHLDAACVQARMGDLLEALDLLMRNKLFEEGANLLIEHYQQKPPLRDPARSRFEPDLPVQQAAKDLIDRLIGGARYEKAAILWDKVLGNRREAIELYARGHNFEAALRLARQHEPDRTVELERSFGDYLMGEFSNNRLSRRRALRAIEHFEAANEPERALDSALVLKEYPQALRQLRQISTTGVPGGQSMTKLGNCSLELAKHFRSSGDTDSAIEALTLGRHYKQVVDLELELGHYERAFKVSAELIHGGDRGEARVEFQQIASQLAASDRYDEAEKIFILLEKADLAVEMHKQAKNHARMLDIVRSYFPDLLESSLLMLAKECESEGRFDEAERYLLQASQSEWTNVVRMYRMANKWSEAYRVALKYCYSRKDPLLVQLAYWWCKSLIKEEKLPEASKLIEDLELNDEVIDFCCENGQFQLAMDLCRNKSENNANQIAKRKTIAKKYATYLEREHKFERAEEVLLAEGQLREIIRMYLDNGMYKDALRVIEERLGEAGDDEAGGSENSELLNGTLIESASRLAAEVGITNQSRRVLQLNGLVGGNANDQAKLLQAQQLYLRAGRPDLVVEMFKEREMWQEAVQVAQRFAPQLIESVELAIDARTSEDLKPIVERTLASKQSSLARSPAGRQQVADSGDKMGQSGAGGSSRRLSSNAEVSMRAGDVRQTRAALGKFLESLVDGNDGGGGTTDETKPGNATQARQVEQLELAANNMLDLLDGSQSIDRCLSAARQVISETNGLGQGCDWGRWTINLAGGGGGDSSWADEDLLLIWRKARNLLAVCVTQLELSLSRKLQQTNMGAHSELLEQLRRRLLAFHYIVLHGYLANQLMINNGAGITQRVNNNSSRPSAHLPNGEPSPVKMERLAAISWAVAVGAKGVPGNETILTLLSRLSLSLLRYTDFLNLSNTLYVAGLWLIVGRRPEVARFVWSRLVELTESGSLASNELDRDQLRRADLPGLAESGSKLNADRTLFPDISSQQMSEVRRWLLESLISGGDTNNNNNNNAEQTTTTTTTTTSRSCGSSTRLSLDERGLWPSSLQESGKGGSRLNACLVCGFPVFANDPERLSLADERRRRPIYQVHLGEWRKLGSELERPKTMTSDGKTTATATATTNEAAALANRYSADRIKLSQISGFISWLSGGCQGDPNGAL